MAAIPPGLLEQIRAASDIVEVIGSYIPLKRAGANFTALCPFHKEKSPSFNVSSTRQGFHCFGCHKGGDVFKFVQEYENISFIEAVRRLAERAKIPLDTIDGPGAAAARGMKEALFDLHEQITKRWQQALANDAAGQIGRDYIAKRQLHPDAVQLFRIGYSPDKWDDTVNFAKSKGFTEEVLEQSGLVIKRDQGDGYYDRFRSRLMFPICDEQGRVIGFSGRVLSGDEKTAKYVNSPETLLFHKSKIFFGLDKSKRAILDAGYAIICEGQIDMIQCFMAGVKNIVAPQGTAFTNDHARILKRYVNDIVLCFDSDNAGQNAAVRALDHLLGAELAIRVAVVPAPHDPDSFIREHGADAYRQLIEKAPSFFDFYLERLCKQNDVATDQGQLAVLRAMAEAVNKANNAVTTDKYAQKTAFRLGVSVDSVRKEFSRKNRPAPQPREYDDAPPEEEVLLERPTEPEMWFLKLLLIAENEGRGWIQHLRPEWITNVTLRKIAEGIRQQELELSWSGPTAFLNTLDNDFEQSLITEAMFEKRVIPDVAKQLHDNILKLRNQYIERQMTAANRLLSQPGITPEEQNTLIQMTHRLRTAKKLPLEEPME
ncbi:MAG: dnaG [Verrucomicrobia bacterium]|jgi:DNA primase|nr:dnaG [Verrucomicrobiota bacterium]